MSTYNDLQVPYGGYNPRSVNVSGTPNLLSSIGQNLAGTIGTGQFLGAALNWYSQYKNVQYQKEWNRQQRHREDTAIQRRVRDMAAAGINPALAYKTAMQGAATGPGMQTQAPQLDTTSIAAMMDAFKQVKEIEKMNAEQKLVNAKITEQNIKNYVSSETAKANIMKVLYDRDMARKKVMESDVRLRKGEIEIAKLELQRQFETGKLTEQELDIAAKAVAIMVAEYNFEWSSDSGYFVGPPTGQFMSWLGSVMANMRERGWIKSN